MQDPCGGGWSGSGVEMATGEVKVLAIAEVAEQEHPEVMTSKPESPRRHADPAGEVETTHPGPGPNAALWDRSSLEVSQGPINVSGDDGPGVGHITVITLADDRNDNLLRPPTGGTDRRLDNGAERMRPAQIDRRLDATELIDLELAGQLAGSVDRRYPGPGGQVEEAQ